MKLQDMQKHERPREKLIQYGKETLGTAELLAILIGNGTREHSALDIAMALLCENKKGLGEIAGKTPEELMATEGIGMATACRILAAAELGRRMAAAPAKDYPMVRGAEDVAALYMEKMRYHTKEHFLGLLLNVRGDVIHEATISIGDICSCASHPREVFSEAVRRSAGAMILIHNHPSGDPTPSDEDISTTKRLSEAGKIIGIPIIDHVIFGDGTYTSMKSAGMMG